MSESFAALFEESLTRTEMRPGEVITAEVVRIDHNHVVIVDTCVPHAASLDPENKARGSV